MCDAEDAEAAQDADGEEGGEKYDEGGDLRRDRREAGALGYWVKQLDEDGVEDVDVERIAFAELREPCRPVSGDGEKHQEKAYGEQRCADIHLAAAGEPHAGEDDALADGGEAEEEHPPVGAAQPRHSFKALEICTEGEIGEPFEKEVA